jgi:ribosome-associated toxin RatA of RatAB toxin-antitoxin module
MLLLFLIYLVRMVMPQISRSALVPYSAEKMYNLVNDVDSYPQFLPGCVGSRVLNYANNEMTASVEVAKAGISKTFVTHNILKDNKSIKIQLVKGPFRKLMGNWLFTPLNENACKVELYLDFEFTNKLIELAFGRIFKELAGNMVQAFTQRAHEVYRG